MQSSTELRQLLLDLWEAFSTGDVTFVDSHVSTDDGVSAIGTDPAEWYEGAAVSRVWKQQLAAAGGVSISPGDIRAYEAGSAGWITDRPTFTFPGGAAFSGRFTAVAHRENGEWKLVHAHTSVGVSNEQLVGVRLPT